MKQHAIDLNRDTAAAKAGPTRRLPLLAPLLLALLLAGCSGNVGVGMNVGIPVGNHGYISVGGGNWF